MSMKPFLIGESEKVLSKQKRRTFKARVNKPTSEHHTCMIATGIYHCHEPGTCESCKQQTESPLSYLGFNFRPTPSTPGQVSRDQEMDDIWLGLERKQLQGQFDEAIGIQICDTCMMRTIKAMDIPPDAFHVSLVTQCIIKEHPIFSIFVTFIPGEGERYQSHIMFMLPPTPPDALQFIHAQGFHSGSGIAIHM